MIERQIVSAGVKEYLIREYIASELKNLGLSNVKMQKTPLGVRIIVSAARPGLIVGRGGENIKRLTEELKVRFHLENPQIEIAEVPDQNLDAAIVSERIANSLERFGIQRFKGIGHRVMTDTMNAGAMGIEILMSGKIPSSRAKTWRFYMGYLKKSGDIALTGVDTRYAEALLKTGIVGIQVRIMPPTVVLPDRIIINDELQTVVEEIKIETKSSKQSKGAKPKSVKAKSAPSKQSKGAKPKPVASKTLQSTDSQPKVKRQSTESSS